MICYCGIGTNLGDRGENIRRALQLLERPALQIRRLSPAYETAPVGLLEQPPFLNAVVELETNLAPQVVLAACQQIEAQMGRQRTVRWGPRQIDLDLLLYGELIFKTEALTIPHPRMFERRFVLVPLADLAPELVAPEQKKNIRELLQACKDQSAVVSSAVSIDPWQ